MFRKIFFFSFLLANQLLGQSALGLEKMNVLFLGEENPLSIAVQGVPMSEIEAKISEGTIKGENGEYIATVNKVGKVTIELFHKGKSIGKHEFRALRRRIETYFIDKRYTQAIYCQSVISNDKMNVMYIGVDNPFSFVVSDYPLDDVILTATGCGISINYGGKFIIRGYAKVNTPGEAIITASTKNKIIQSFKFRVQRIPNSKISINIDHPHKSGGSIPVGLFRSATAIEPYFDEEFFYENNCAIQSFTLTRKRKGAFDFSSVEHDGGKFNAQALKLIQTAQIGDEFIFENIKGRCPGDTAGQTLFEMKFTLF